MSTPPPQEFTWSQSRADVLRAAAETGSSAPPIANTKFISFLHWSFPPLQVHGSRKGVLPAGSEAAQSRRCFLPLQVR